MPAAVTCDGEAMRLVPGAALLWRGGEQHQVGIERGVRLTAEEAEALARAGGLVPARPASLTARLRRAGLVASDEAPAPRVRVRGLSSAGVAAAEALARAGARLSLVDGRIDDPRTAEPAALPALGGGTRAERASRLIRDLRPGAALDLDQSRAVDVEVVVACGTLPPVLLHRLMAGDVPHAAVLTDERGATVLPVIPGASPCVRCRDVARTRRDPAWPALMRQCETLPAATDAATAAVAGALAASAALALARGDAPPAAWRVERGHPTTLMLGVDARCGCAGPPAPETRAG